MKLVSFLAAVVLAVPLSAGAAPGDIDVSYGSAGVARFSLDSTFPHDLDFTSDGGVVAGGAGTVVAKFNAAGALDPAFGSGGTTRRVEAQFFHRVVAVRTLASGRLQVVEELDDPCVGSPFFCSVQSYGDELSYRLLPGGARDPDYGIGGQVQITDTEGPAMVIQPTGEVITFAFVRQLATLPVFKVVALDRNGNRDAAYEARARAAVDCGAALGLPVVSPAAATASGARTIVATRAGTAGAMRICVFRLEADGSPDPTFGSGGYVVVQPPTLTHEPVKVLVRSDGRILVVLAQPVQFNLANGHGNPALAWLTAAGAPDATLADAGITYPALFGLGLVFDFALQADDKVLAVGMSATAPGTPESATRPRLVRMDARGGTPDFSFGPLRGGYVDLVTAAGALMPTRLRTSAAGIFIAGRFVPTGTEASEFAVMKVKDAADPPPVTNEGGGGGGGCGSISTGGPADPTLPALAMLALLALLSGKGRRSRLARPARARGR
jgi:uncharacterized delta-60 repeat protein